MENSTTTPSVPGGESKLTDDLVRLQIRVFMSSLKRLGDQQAKAMETIAGMLRAQAIKMKQLEIEVTEFRDLLESHGRLEDSEDTLRHFASTMYDSRKKFDMAVQGVEQALAGIEKRGDTENEDGATGKPAGQRLNESQEG